MGTEVKELMINDLLQDKTVAIRYVLDFKNNVDNKDHSLYGGLTNNAVIAIPAPIMDDRGRNQLLSVFTKEELALLAAEMQDPNVADVQSDFWKDYKLDSNRMPIGKFPIHLKKEGLLLDMNEPLDYIYYKVLVNHPLVAKSKEDVPYNASHRFYAIESDKVFEDRVNAISFKKKAYVEYGKIEGRRDEVVFIIRSLGAMVDSNAHIDFLNNTLFELMEDKTREFLSIASDKNLKYKVNIEKLVGAGLILIKEGLYFTADGAEKLQLNGEVNDLDGAANYLSSSLGQETFLKLTAAYKQINQAK